MDNILLKDVSKKDVGRIVFAKGKIEVVKQTTGPTLMVLNDGTGNFTLKAFIKPGVRAYPDIDIGDIAEVKMKISERQGSIEGEVSFMKKLNDTEVKLFEQKLEKLQAKRFVPEVDSFTIKSKMLESQKDRFVKVATIIRRAVVEGRPILLRHNADCDGYSSAITIERAILGYINEVTNGDRLAAFQNYKRAPSKAPFYEYEDSVKDVSNWLRDRSRNNAKPPLIVVTDNGSTFEDILSMRQMKIYDAQIVVVDHHFCGEVKSGKVEVDEYVEAHINPYLTGFDSNVCAGMLGYELANFIFKNNNNSVFIPAMAGVLDHCDSPEKDLYVELAKKEGFTEKYLAELGEIVDMQSHYFRFMESREFFNDLFGANMDMQKKIVALLTPELKQRYDKTEKVGKHYSEKKDFGKFYLMTFNGEKGTFRGDYPAIGKATNHIHRVFEQEMDKPVITVTHGTTFMTIRVSDAIKGFSVPEFVSQMFKKLPHINANGGGHEHAGSVRFVEFGRDEIFDLFNKYLLSVNKKN